MFGPDIAFALLVGEHLTIFGAKRRPSHCVCFLVLLLAQLYRWNHLPHSHWEPRGVPLGTGTSVPRVGGHAVHRDEESPPRGRKIASPSSTGAVFRWRDGHASGATRRIVLPISHVGSAARRSTSSQPVLAKKKTTTPSPTRGNSCRTQLKDLEDRQDRLNPHRCQTSDLARAQTGSIQSKSCTTRRSSTLKNKPCSMKETYKNLRKQKEFDRLTSVINTMEQSKDNELKFI